VFGVARVREWLGKTPSGEMEDEVEDMGSGKSRAAFSIETGSKATLACAAAPSLIQRLRVCEFQFASTMSQFGALDSRSRDQVVEKSIEGEERILISAIARRRSLDAVLTETYCAVRCSWTPGVEFLTVSMPLVSMPRE